MTNICVSKQDFCSDILVSKKDLDLSTDILVSKKKTVLQKKWFKSKAFVQTFWFDQRKTFPQQMFLVCCKAFVQTVWIKSKIFPHKYLYFKARVSFRHFGFQARLLLKLYSKEFHLNMLVSLQDLCSHILWIKSLV